MTDAPYDFSSLRRPLSRREARERRRTLLAGKSLWSALEAEHFAGLLIVGGIGIFMLIPTAVVMAIATLLVSGSARTPDEFAGVVLLVVLSPLAAVTITYFSMRALLIPPRWRAWARMQRFAEENGLEFVREEEGVQIAGSLTPRRRSLRPPRLYGGFRDTQRGIMLGDWVLPALTTRGFGDWLGVIEVRTTLSENERPGHGAVRDTLDEVAGGWSIEVQKVADGVVAVKRLPFRTRNPARLERAFRIAWALHEEVSAPRG